ncbi:hypothetical protein AGOR_G00219250 [Albula goreensis]|uniref:Beta-galactoside alpha-2,6-sialyltransferase 2 n=1 Tax=Albula goreensis TaxID=1534307 RepID=A0A8T3CPA6_9TELE|nr:hypothetical protein AGOR_G00219250 [Albula goreensis]
MEESDVLRGVWLQGVWGVEVREMKASMKQWKQLVLLGMLAWALLFLALFTYCMDAQTEEPRPSAPLSHSDTRRLASIQAESRGARPDGSSPAPDREQKLPPNPDPPRGEETDGKLYDSQDGPGGEAQPEPGTTVAWTPLGNEAGASSKVMRGGQDRTGWITASQHRNREQEEEEVHTRRTTRRKRRRWQDLEDLEEYHFSKSKSVVQRLWKGEVSAHMLSPRLQKAMKDYLSANKHRVAYGGRRRTPQSGQQALCEMKRQVQVRALDGTEPPFSTLGWDRLVPSRPLEQLYGARFSTCAVVTSAGAILNSSLGKEIDSHEAVLRFNAAPTEGYENDVGNKTTIRIINSQILANPKHRFNSSSLYKDIALVAWDPAPYTVNLQKWYKSPDYNLFSPYGHTQENIQPNPPSSGFIGIVLMMALCEEVHVYEYIPSLRQTDLCHYHERYYDAACTLGAYHPLLYEKMLVQRMNTGTKQALKKKGRVTLPGFSAVQCDP